MIMNEMVVATKYQLLVPKSIKHGTWDVEGQKKAVIIDAQIPRYMVEDANNRDNNVLWVIDEEKTAALEGIKAEKLKTKQINDQKTKVGAGALVDAMLEKITGKENKTKVPSEHANKSVEEIRAILDERGIEYHHKSGKAALLKLL